MFTITATRATARYDIIFPSPFSATIPDIQAPLCKLGLNKFNDEVVVLSPDNAARVTRFREKLGLRETNLRRYELCIQVRNKLFAEHTGVEFLAAAYEHIMSSQCAEYKD